MITDWPFESHKIQLKLDFHFNSSSSLLLLLQQPVSLSLSPCNAQKIQPNHPFDETTNIS